MHSLGAIYAAEEQQIEAAEEQKAQQTEDSETAIDLPKATSIQAATLSTGSDGSQVPFPAQFNQLLKSFQTDLYTGKATFNIPIIVTPGRKGIQPNLNLIYQSGGPNTWCGVGWMLDTGSISRSTKKGVPKYDNTDTFVFNYNGSNNELVNIGGNEHRAKIESAFMKFEYDSATDSWIVTDAAGNKYYFGRNINSKQRNANGTATFSWYLNEVVDVYSNYLRITYNKYVNYIYPLRIEYTGNYNSGFQPAYSVEFICDDGNTRPDKPINYRSSAKIQLRKRLNEIHIKYKGFTYWRYVLTYQISPDTGYSLLRQITLYDKDNRTLPSSTFTYSSGDRLGGT